MHRSSISRSRSRSRAVAAVVLPLLAALLPAALDQRPAAAQVLTFSVKYENKLFINTIPLGSCNPRAVLGLVTTPAQLAAYLTFCQATSLGENPPTGAIVAPLDARIRSGVTVQWKCRAGNPNPFAGNMAALGTVGGLEGPAFLNIRGIVNPTTTRNNINANGTWGAVISGHPNPIVEPAFQIHRLRRNTDIWEKLTGTIICGVDGRGLPTSRVANELTYTRFPSHKVWYTTPANAPPPGILYFNLAQGAFSNLWFLPAVPAP